MELLSGNVKRIYFKYLGACFGSALISSIYQLVDTVVVGQYQGPQGTAALAVVMPLWTIVYSLGLLFGVGGSVLLANARGAGDGRAADRWYTLALLGAGTAAVLAWLGAIFFQEPLLRLFGADEALLPLAKSYLRWVVPVLPAFTMGQFLAAFLRNDGAPGLATAAVIAGGVFNIFGDLFFVFGLDMGMEGAGLATGLGQLMALGILCTRFYSKKRGFHWVRPHRAARGLGDVLSTGASAFVVDVSMGVLAALFNNQIMGCAGPAALAVYGVACNTSTLVQCFAYGVGQAAQPLLSVNFGGHKLHRVRQTLTLALGTAAVMGLGCTALALAFPLPLVRLFMDATPQVLSIAGPILRTYVLAFLPLPFNVLSTYYFQSVLRPRTALAVSLLRGIVLSGGLVLLLPVLLGPGALWWAAPAAEGLSALLVAALMLRSRAQLREQA